MPRHPAQLVQGVRDCAVALHHRPVRLLLDRRFRDVYPVVHHQQRVYRLHHLVVQRNAVQVLLQQRFQLLVVRLVDLLLLLNRQLVQQHLVVALQEFVEVAELCELLSRDVNEIVF